MNCRETFERLYEDNFVLTLTVMARKECIESVGAFDERLLVSQDYDLWLRLASKYEFRHIDIPLAKYRSYENNISKKLRARMQNHEYLLNKKYIAQHVNYFGRKVRLAKAYYYFGTLFFEKKGYHNAGVSYLKSVLTFPFIGSFYWPEEIKKMRFSLPYRILKVYFLIAICISKSLVEKSGFSK